MKILVVEDNQQIMETLCDYLNLKGHQVDCAYHGEAALTILQQQRFDIIVMDIMMPKLDGIQTVQRLRQLYHLNTPVLFLTARDHLDDKLTAFQAGGDDYLVKPFAMEELLVRLEALAKRGLRQDLQLLQVGELHFDLSSQQANRAGKPLKLSKIQCEILKQLMCHYPAMVSRQQLFDSIWQGEEPDSDVLRSHIYSLRNVLDKDFSRPMLETVHGQGYRLVAN
jgi:DNA-binding response OmpR family regulator